MPLRWQYVLYQTEYTLVVLRLVHLHVSLVSYTICFIHFHAIVNGVYYKDALKGLFGG